MSISKNITQVGIELEGGWDGYFSYEDEIKEDVSVEVCDEDGGALSYVGEIASPPFDDLDAAFDFLEPRWPDYYNWSCGMHVHLEASPLLWMAVAGNYSRLCDRFLALLRTEMEQPCRYNIDVLSYAVERWEGSNRFCRPINDITTVLTMEDGDRYRAFNAWSYSAHRTLEVRAWPQGGYREGRKFLDWTVEELERLCSEYDVNEHINAGFYHLPELVLPAEAGIAVLDSYADERSRVRKRQERCDCCLESPCSFRRRIRTSLNGLDDGTWV